MTKDEIIALAREAWKLEHIPESDVAKLTRFAKLVAEYEREQCAQVCDELGDASKITYAGLGAIYCAEAIRAKSDQPFNRDQRIAELNAEIAAHLKEDADVQRK